MCYNANHHQQAPCSPLLVASGSPELLLLVHYLMSYSNAAYNLEIISHIASVLALQLLQLLQGLIFLPG